MNRLIIIGNGFDLAHNLPTSYKDFIEWYWDKWRKRIFCSDHRNEEDQLCLFKMKKGSQREKLWELREIDPHLFEEKTPVKDFITALNTGEIQCDFEIKSELFRTICKSYEMGKWVDIESIFYQMLCSKIDQAYSPKRLNDDLDFIKNKLIDYLNEIQNRITDNITQKEIQDRIFEPIKNQDVAISSMSLWNDMLMQRIHFKKESWLDLVSAYRNTGRIPDAIYYIEQFIEDNAHRIEKKEFDKKLIENIPDEYCLPDSTMLLNFNYTTIADDYFKPNDRLIINHIHGTLAASNNVIFGYGDELDEQYKILVNKKENLYLDNIKSIKYLESSNYRRLLSFVNADAFQIYIMGHSCGNSDRTLLNTLFEHKNCVSIKPYYHKRKDGSDNYMDLVQNISRNFTDMKLMRDRVVNKTFCVSLSDN